MPFPLPPRRRALGCAAALLVFCVGVAVLLPGRRQPRVPVSGRVTVDGQPLGSGLIDFVPNKAKGNKSPLPAQGRVKGGTYEVEGGVQPGWYRVVVRGNLASGPGRRPRGFSNGDKPAVVEIVGSGGAESYDFTLASPPARRASTPR